MNKKGQARVLKLKPRTASKAYELAVFLIGGSITNEFAKKNKVVSRTIQIRGDQTLADLHEAIFAAFDREEMHLYEFQFGKGPHDPKGPRYTVNPQTDSALDRGKPPGDAEKTTLDSLGLKVGRAFGYWFDFGDNWWHQINVTAIHGISSVGWVPRLPRIVARKGKSPPQYAADDEDDES